MNPEIMAQVTLSRGSHSNATPSWLKVEITPELSKQESQQFEQWSYNQTKVSYLRNISSKITQTVELGRNQLMSMFDKLVAILKNQKFSPIN